MKYHYSKPIVKINNWLVNKNDILRIIHFFRDRFPDEKEIAIELITESGNNCTFENEEELIEHLPKILSDKEIVTNINIAMADHDVDSSKFKYIQFDIDFKYN